MSKETVSGEVTESSTGSFYICPCESFSAVVLCVLETRSGISFNLSSVILPVDHFVDLGKHPHFTTGVCKWFKIGVRNFPLLS